MMQTSTRSLCLAVAALITIAPATSSLAASTPEPPQPIAGLQGRPDVAGEEMLGGSYQNPAAGIAFRTAANCVQVKKSDEQIARFVNEKAGWEITCLRNSSSQPMPLTGGGAGGPKLGLLEVVVARLKQGNPGVDIIREEVEDLGEYKAGLIVARLAAVGQRKLLQQAIIQANDQLYYTLVMTSPASKDAKGPDSDDPGERIAAESFRQMLDTVKLLDRSHVKEDQNQRLFRTRAFFATLTPKKLRETLIPEQWMRLIQNGKDIGYTYIVEEPDDQAGADGIKIGIRSRSYPDASTQVDGETWFIVTGDRRHENFSNLVWLQNRKTRQSEQITEIGSSDRRTRRQAEIGAGALAAADGAKDPKVAIYDTYELNVKTIARSATAEPLKRSLPPFYVPQAVGHLLPRLLPLREPKTFLFATYVGDRREVMMRYVDVGTEQEVELGGQRVRAVPITDRLGLEGSPTIHYVDPATRTYLGSVNQDSKITILPTDAETLKQKWTNADLSRPKPAAPGEIPRSDDSGAVAR